MAGKRRFDLPQALVPAAQSWRDFGSRRPRTAQDAASVVMVRDGSNGPQVLLACRDIQSPLGAVTFPGGACTDTDEQPLPWYGPPERQWARQLNVSDYRQVRKYVVAAIRELYEHTGILLAGADEFSLAENMAGEEAMQSRQALALEELSFAELMQRRGWGVRSDLLRPIGCWTSPDFAHRRYRTHYFVAAAPSGAQLSALAETQQWVGWVDVRQLLETAEQPFLAELIGREELAGMTLRQLCTPQVQLLCETLAGYPAAVAFLLSTSPYQQVPYFHSELMDNADGTPELEVSLPEKKTLWSGRQHTGTEGSLQ